MSQNILSLILPQELSHIVMSEKQISNIYIVQQDTQCGLNE